jgi:hypothetical protein
MPRLIRDLVGVEPVDAHGTATGPAVTLPAQAEFIVTIRKMKRPSDSFEEVWCEILVGAQLYRVPLRLLETANAA